MALTVGDLSRIAGVSVRTLHHYDEIGLVRPSGRSQAGYRLYTERDLARLQQALFFRELGFKLEHIVTMLDDPAFDRKKALVAQRAMFEERIDRARAALELIDKTVRSLEGGKAMKSDEMFSSGFDHATYEKEAEERWGKTDAHAESKRRTSRYTKEDWAKIEEESTAIVLEFARAAEEGIDPTDARAMHAGLGQMYVDDPRFSANYERHRAGLAQYVCDAIRANAAR